MLHLSLVVTERQSFILEEGYNIYCVAFKIIIIYQIQDIDLTRSFFLVIGLYQIWVNK